MLLVIEAVVLHNASMLDAKTVEGIESKFLNITDFGEQIKGDFDW